MKPVTRLRPPSLALVEIADSLTSARMEACSRASTTTSPSAWTCPGGAMPSDVRIAASVDALTMLPVTTAPTASEEAPVTA